MFEINDRFNFFDEPIDLFKDNELDFYFEKDKRSFNNKKTINPFEIRKVKYKNFFEKYTITQTRDLHLADFSNNSQWTEIDGILQNKDIGNNQSATLEGNFDNVTTISFDCKVSSEENYDFLTIYINGEQKIHISGEVDWQTHSYTINGNLDFKAVYSKDVSNSEGSDTGYLRNIVITQTIEHITEPMKFAILRDFENIKNINPFEIKNYVNKTIINPFEIKNYVNKQNFVFERIAFIQIPPKRVIMRDFNE